MWLPLLLLPRSALPRAAGGCVGHRTDVLRDSRDWAVQHNWSCWHLGQAHHSYAWSASRGCHRLDCWAGNNGHPSQVHHTFCQHGRIHGTSSCFHHRQLLHHHVPLVHVHSLFPQRCFQWCISDYHGWIPLIEQEVVPYDFLQPCKHLCERARFSEIGYSLLEVSPERCPFRELVLRFEVLASLINAGSDSITIKTETSGQVEESTEPMEDDDNDVVCIVNLDESNRVIYTDDPFFWNG
jgi:hypothetical protein